MKSARKNYVRNQKLMAVLESFSKQISNVLSQLGFIPASESIVLSRRKKVRI